MLRVTWLGGQIARYQQIFDLVDFGVKCTVGSNGSCSMFLGILEESVKDEHGVLDKF